MSFICVSLIYIPGRGAGGGGVGGSHIRVTGSTSEILKKQKLKGTGMSFCERIYD